MNNNRPMFPWQEKIVKWGITNRSGLILADLGAGKTRAMLEIIRVRKAAGHIKRVLILSRKDIVDIQWTSSIPEWAPDLSFTLLSGLNPKDREESFYQATDIHLLNIELLKWIQPKLMEKAMLHYDMIVLDESTLIKNTVNSKRWKLIKPLAKLVWDKGGYLYGMTATPAPNEVGNIFPQVVFVRPDGETFGTTFPSHFNQMYCNPHPYIQYKYVFDPSYTNFLYERLSDVSIRIKLDKKHTPGHTKNYINLELPKDARNLYNQMEKTFLTEVDGGEISASQAGVKSAKLWQMANGAVYDEDGTTRFLHNVKLDRLEDLIEEMNGDSILVTYWFKSDIQMIRARLSDKKYSDANVEYIEGGTKNTKQIVDRFNEGTCKILVAQAEKVSRGLNLQHKCNHMCLYSMLWDFEVYEQLIGRLDRTGQEKHVFVHHLIMRDTMDDMTRKMGAFTKIGIKQKLDQKDKVQQSLLEFLHQKQKDK